MFLFSSKTFFSLEKNRDNKWIAIQEERVLYITVPQVRDSATLRSVGLWYKQNFDFTLFYKTIE